MNLNKEWDGRGSRRWDRSGGERVGMGGRTIIFLKFTFIK